jgi:hypothetical protein
VKGLTQFSDIPVCPSLAHLLVLSATGRKHSHKDIKLVEELPRGFLVGAVTRALPLGLLAGAVAETLILSLRHLK